MPKRIRRHVTFANVVAIMALIIAVGSGSAYALQGQNTVFSDDVAPDAIKGKDTKEVSLKIPRIRVIRGNNLSTAAGQTLQASAECPDRYTVTGGGFDQGGPPELEKMQITHSFPHDDGSGAVDSWEVYATSTGVDQTVYAFAICQKGSTTGGF